jgi:hypothetical protein
MTILLAAVGAFGGETVSIDDRSVSETTVSPNPAEALYELTSGGDVYVDPGGTVETWVSPAPTSPGSYEVKATVTAGALSSGTTGSWLALSSNRSWSVGPVTLGNANATLTIEIRKDGVVLDSATITLEAEASL